MFENAEKQLKKFAEVTYVCSLIIGLLGVIFSIGNRSVLGILISILWVLAAYFTFLIISVFAEILQNVKETNNTLSIAYANELSEHNIIMQKEKQRREEAAARLEENALRMAAATEAAAEKAKARYWTEHAEEKSALLEKKRIAEEKLGELGNFAIEERKAIRSLIHSIDEELNKPR